MSEGNEGDAAKEIREDAVKRIRAMRDAKDRGEVPEKDVVDAIDQFIQNFGFRGLASLDREDKKELGESESQ